MARFQQIVPTVCLSGLVAGAGWLVAAPAIAGDTASRLLPMSAAAVDTIAQVPNEPAGYTILQVNAIAGDDTVGDGSQLRPFQTITHALTLAEANTLILLARGTYSAASGETFPLQMRPGVTIQGMAGPNAAAVAIAGGGTYYSRTAGMQNVAILGADNAGLANVSVSNPHAEGIGLWVEAGSPIIMENAFVQNGATGIYVVGAGAPVIRGNYFARNGRTGLVIAGPSTAQIEANVFENTGTGIMVAPESTPEIINNQIFGNLDGLVLHAEARPRLRGNQIARNRRNSIVDYAAWTTVPHRRPPMATQPPPPTAAVTTRAIAPSSTGAIVAPPTATAPTAPRSPEITVVPESTPTATRIAPLPTADPIALPAESPTEPTESPTEPLTTASERLPTDADSTDTDSAIEEELDANSALAAMPAPVDDLAELSEATGGDRRRDEIDTITDLPNAVDMSLLPASTATTAQNGETLAPIRDAAPALSADVAAATVSSAAEAAMASSETRRSEPLPIAEAAGLTALRPAPATATAPPASETIDIPVIPPPLETTVKPIDAPQSRESLSQNLAYALETGDHLPEVPVVPPTEPIAPTSQRLAVPSRRIPLGSGGSSLPEVFTTGAVAGLPAEGPPPPPSLATSLGLNYKVLVAAADEATQAAVRSQVPDAFRLQFNGQSYIQAGAYPTREEAQTMLNQLQQAGLPAQIQEIR